MMIVKPSIQERIELPDAIREYIEGIELHNEALRKQHFEAKTLSEIKDCPWCDIPPTLVEIKSEHFTLSCVHKECAVQPHTSGNSKLQAILAWNRRNRSLELTAHHCDYYEEELIPRLKAKVINNLRLAEHWNVSYTLICEDLKTLKTLQDLVKTYFVVNDIGCECCNVSDCGECMVCLILELLGVSKDVEKSE